MQRILADGNALNLLISVVKREAVAIYRDLGYDMDWLSQTS